MAVRNAFALTAGISHLNGQTLKAAKIPPQPQHMPVSNKGWQHAKVS